MDKLLEIVNVVRVNKGYKPLNSITNEQKLRDDLGFNSFDLAELTVRIEDVFDIDIFEDGIVSTYGEIKEKLKLNE